MADEKKILVIVRFDPETLAKVKAMTGCSQNATAVRALCTLAVQKGGTP